MRPTSKKVNAMALLELLLAIAILALAVQLIPALDFRNCSRGVWMAANALVIATLLATRFFAGHDRRLAGTTRPADARQGQLSSVAKSKGAARSIGTVTAIQKTAHVLT